MLNHLLVLVVLYVILESMLALFSMDGGLQHFCTKVKYILMAGTSAVLGHLIFTDPSHQALYIFVSLTLFFSVLPRMVWRLRNWGLLSGDSDMSFLAGVALGAAFSKFWIAGWNYVKPYIPFINKGQ